jgi:hypothetical protein
LPARPSSDPHILNNNSINKDDFNKRFINNRDDFNKRFNDDESRRVSDPGTSQCRTVENVFFEGPISRKSIDGQSLYDVPRVFEDSCYAVPPKPVPVSAFIKF